jgi:hypothetical protein
MGSGYIDPHFLDLGTSWRWVLSFTHRRLYPQGKSPRSPLDRRLGGLQSRSGRREENSSHYQNSNSDPSVVQPVASRYTDYAIPAPHLNVLLFQTVNKPFRSTNFILCKKQYCGIGMLACMYVRVFGIPNNIWACERIYMNLSMNLVLLLTTSRSYSYSNFQ